VNDRYDITTESVATGTTEKRAQPFSGRWAEIAAAARRSGARRFSIWVDSFLYAGLSSLLLLIANLFEAQWYLSLVALTPFLIRVSRADGEEGARLGFLMGLSYLSVSSLTVPSPTAAGWWLTLVTGTVLFTLCGWSMGWARTAFGFRPTVIALLWAAFELGYRQISHSAGLLGQPALSDPYLQGLAALFGFVAFSTLIVLVNSLLVLAFRAVASMVYSGRKIRRRHSRPRWFIPAYTIKRGDVFLIPESRGPPVSVLF
jgi:hypothetical protein